MEKQRKDISPEETLTQPFIVGIPDFRSGVVLNFEMDYIQSLRIVLPLAGSGSVRRDLPGPDTED